MKIWPGKPYPFGATWDGAASIFPCSPRTPQRSNCACSTAAEAQRNAHPAARADASGLASLPARSAAGPALRLSRPRPVRARKKAIASIRQSCCSIRTPRRSPARFNWSDALFGYTIGDPDRICRSTSATARRAHAEVRGRSTRRSPGATTAAAHAVAQDDHLRAARQGLHQAASRRAAESCAAPMPALAVRPAIEHLNAARRHRGRADAGASFIDDHHLSKTRADQLLGLQHARLLRPGRALRRRRRQAASRCASSRRWCERCTRPASR